MCENNPAQQKSDALRSDRQELSKLKKQADLALKKNNEIATQIWKINLKISMLSEEKENLKTNDSKENIDSILFEEKEKKIAELSKEKESLQTQLNANHSQQNIGDMLSKIEKLEKDLNPKFNIHSPYPLN